ncbi:MAG: MFS transporter [Alphaproteobacteria bacterium]|nr:MFS transporter [Alphaproteobacteria bacterium]
MKKNKILFSSIIANSLEFYDLTLFSIFLPVLTPVFFQGNYFDRDFITGWVIFAAGFVMRPVGAVIFGHFGDKYGRKKTLSLTILLMAISTIIIGVLPSYNVIGIWAFFILIMCRFSQGLCAGGEHNGAAIFSLEHLNNIKTGLAGGLISGSCFIGAIIANLMGYLSTSQILPIEGWRLAFILGGVISLIIYKIRLKIHETPEFESIKINKEVKRVPLFSALQSHRLSCFITFMIGLIDGSLCYTLLVFFSTYLTQIHGLQISEVMILNMVGLVIAVLFTPISGWFSDKIGTHNSMMISCMSSAIFILPIFFLLKSTYYSNIILSEMLIGLLIAGILGPQHSFFQNLFPPQIRYSGIGVFYCLGISLGGATIPLILDYLMNMEEYYHIVFIPLPFIFYGMIAFFSIYKNYNNCCFELTLTKQIKG